MSGSLAQAGAVPAAGAALVLLTAADAAATAPSVPVLPCPEVRVAFGPFSVPAAVRETVAATLRERGRAYVPTVEDADLSVYYLPIANAGDDVTIGESLAGVTRVQVLSDRPAARRSLGDRLRELTPPCREVTASPAAPASPAPVVPSAPAAATTPQLEPSPSASSGPAGAAAPTPSTTGATSAAPVAAPEQPNRWGQLLGVVAAGAALVGGLVGLLLGRRRVRALHAGGSPGPSGGA